MNQNIIDNFTQTESTLFSWRRNIAETDASVIGECTKDFSDVPELGSS
jgi:hypothetical protein